MIEFLLILTAILSIRLDSDSMLAVLFFSGFCLLYNYSEQYVTNNYMYYILASLVDLVIITFLSTISKPTELVVMIQMVCRWFIYVNILGFVIYHFELPPIIYSVLCGSLYVAALLSTISRGGFSGVYRSNNVHSNIHTHYFTSKIALRKNKKTIRN